MFWSAAIFRVSALPAATIPSPAVWRYLGSLMASTSSPEQVLCVPTPPAPTCDSHPGSMLRGSQLPTLRFTRAGAAQVFLGTNTRAGSATLGHHRRGKSVAEKWQSGLFWIPQRGYVSRCRAEQPGPRLGSGLGQGS